jgi:pyruvate,orthophosphate dikinase
MQFGDKEKPLLVSVRSGARASMPGMMDTILNLGMNDEAVEAVSKRTGNPRFAWDSYRRFVQMYGDVVLGMKPVSKQDQDPFEVLIDEQKEKRGVEQDTDLTVEDLKELVAAFKAAVKEQTGKDFPTCPWEQLWGAVCAVFGSWMNDRAILYRKLNNIPEEWGTAVSVQAMVFGNMGENSATGVAFSRDAATGENIFNGEYLVNAQGEDVVAGIRTPQQITIEGSRRWAKAQNISEEDRAQKYPSLEEVMPAVYAELNDIQHHLEQYFTDMQDIEFTIQDGKLWMLQCRNGKRTGAAMVKIAMDMLREGLIDEKTAVLRCEPAKLDELLHPVFDKRAIKSAKVLVKGLPASPGAATGPVVFFAEDAEKVLAETGQKAILVRIETSPEDLKGMLDAAGILTARGGMTSHAAVVARGMGKCCVSGAGELAIDYKARTIKVNGYEIKEGDWISLNGSTGEVYLGQVATEDADLSGDFGQLMELAGKYATMKVRANADTPRDAEQAFAFGAEGIGLCRTEHMFFEGDRIKAVREMILADDEAGRRVALAKLLPMQRGDFEGLFKAMKGYPVIIRLLDPPLHEFAPHTEKEQRELAEELGVPFEKIAAKVEYLGEVNPMLGHRGCRLGNTYPEITEMQARAILEAAMNVEAAGTPVKVEIMVPLVGNHKELRYQKNIIDSVAEQVFAERNDRIDYLVGTMIEVPRAAVTADQIAEVAEFFSFGTNDLTQMTLGFSRDDIAKFLPTYLDKGILKNDPFQILDRNGVGQLIREAVMKGRGTRLDLKCGICGEHGGEPSSVEFCHYAGLNYVSCSPFRVPIARLAAAHAALNQK